MEKEDYITLFNSWLTQNKNAVVFLLDHNKNTVGALYLSTLRNKMPDFSNLAIMENKGSEKYYIYIDGVGIFFTYFNKGEL